MDGRRTSTRRVAGLAATAHALWAARQVARLGEVPVAAYAVAQAALAASVAVG